MTETHHEQGSVLSTAYAYAGALLFAAVVVWAALFISDRWLPVTLNRGPERPGWLAMLINLGLLALFVVQHTVMARSSYKRWTRRFLPRPYVRSTFVMVSVLVLAALFLFWSPLPATIWKLEHPAARGVMHALSALSGLLVLLSIRTVDAGHLIGLPQSRGKRLGDHTPELVVKGVYKVLRHPMMAGLIVALWATPHLTAGRALLAAGFTAYIFLGIHFEERDLVQAFGDDYRRYRSRVGALLPRRRPARDTTA
ncbi:MAG: isoprenylcysteine carboxylmethyltransferase family protein [Candidatus Lernaella stagnicola]|nr:isoprenylcysteine carboxylmethyltransferase family protein [Candidatus Lernaella stagnicola]